MRSLDYLLHAWLSQPEERGFERAFNAYFQMAFPAVVRHLAQLSHWDRAHLEDVAQEALLRFFEKVGRERPQAARAIEEILTRIHPLGLGPMHEKQLCLWTAALSSFRQSAMNLGTRADPAGEARRESVGQDAPEQMILLQEQGRRLLQTVDRALEGTAEGDADPQALLGREHVARFRTDVRTVIELLPRLRVPSSGFLFQIAVTAYLDESRRRRRQKRAGVRHIEPGENALGADPGRRPAWLGAGDGEDYDAESAGMRVDEPSTPWGARPAIDPAQRCENQDFFEKFYRYLREPLDRATHACERAREAGRVPTGAERREADSLTHKFARTISVLSLLGQGYSQEQTAARLGLTRNQVKYVIEITHTAYSQFAACSLRASTPRQLEEAPHAS
jgi:DNA-directed RNA polymerase specialized sigma24 family protein